MSLLCESVNDNGVGANGEYTVVLVHSLDSDSSSAKQQFKSLISILKASLPSHFISITKFTYSSSDVIQGRHSGDTLKSLSLNLVTQLKAHRDSLQSPKRSPIIFMGHGLGGTIIKYGMALAARNRVQYGDIYFSTRLFLFFNCIHRASTHWGVVNCVARWLLPFLDVDSPLLHSAESLASVITEVNEIFVETKMPQLYRVGSIVCLGRDSIDQALGNFSYTLGTFHEKTIYMTGKEDGASSGPLTHLIDAALRLSNKPEQNEWLQVTKFLAPPEMPTAPPLQMSNIIMGKVHASDTYLEFRDAQSPMALVLYGSYSRDIAHKLYHEFQQNTTTKERLVLHFTFDHYDERRNSVVPMATSFIAQILSGSDAFVGKEPFFRQRKKFQSWSPYDALSALYHLSAGREILFVVENIDQCEVRSRELFFQHFGHPLSLTDNNIKLVLTTEKLLGDLNNFYCLQFNTDLKQLPEDTSISYDHESCGEANSQGIQNLEAAHIETLATCVPPLLLGTPKFEKCLTILSKISCGDKLVALTIEASLSVPLDRLSLIDANSPELIFQQIIENIPKTERELVQKVMVWVLLPLQPLSIQQLAAVVSWIPNCQLPGDLAHDKSFCLRALSPILELLWGLIVVENNQIRPSHPSVRSLFTENKGEWFSVTSNDHGRIALFCLELLQLEEFQQWENRNRGFEYRFETGETAIFPVSIFEDRSSLHWYAIMNWTEHYRRTPLLHRPRIELLTFFSDKSKLAWNNWAETRWAMSNPISRGERPKQSLESPLPFLAELEEVELLRDCITNAIKMNREIPCGEFGAALVRATVVGGEKVVEYLLGLENNYAKEFGLRESLIAAAASGNSRMLLKLISNAPEDFVWPPSLLSRVSELGLEESVSELLIRGCLPSSQYRISGLSPFHHAIENGHKSICEILLQYQANGIKYNDGSTAVAVMAAGSPRGAEVLGILSEYGFNLLEKNPRSALKKACKLGHVEVVKAFLEIVRNGGSQPPDIEKCLRIAVDRGSSLIITPLLNMMQLGTANSHVSSIIDQQLARAIKNNSKTAVETLLTNGANANAKMIGGHSMLYQACSLVGETGLAIVKLLIENGADVESSSENMVREPLLEPVIRNGNIECLRYLIARSIGIKELDPEKTTPLLYAARLGNLECVRVLLEGGSDINWRNDYGNSALFEAAAKEHFEVAEFLLNRGADVSKTGWRGRNIVQLCLASPQTLRKVLERRANPNLRDNRGLAPVHYAIMNSHAESIKILAEFNADVEILMPASVDKIPPLMLAVEKDFMLVATQHLLDAGANANYQAKLAKNQSALHIAATAEMIGLLLQYGADVNCTDDDGNTALHYQASRPLPNHPAIKRLVGARADINAKNRSGLEPLFYLAQSNDLHMVKYLLSKGADPNAASDWFGSPLHAACFIGKLRLVTLLLEDGAHADLGVSGLYGSPLQAACLGQAKDHKVLELIKYIVNITKADVNQVCGLYGTAVHTACRRNSLSALEQLVDYKANLQVPDMVGRLPIHLAAVAQFDSFKCLVKNGCEMNVTDKTGRTLLHWAAQSSNTKIIKLLLSQPHVDIDAADHDGWTALCWAARGRSPIASSNCDAQAGIVKLLIERGASKSVQVQGDCGEIWTPLEMAIFHDTGDRVIKLLTEHQPIDNSSVKNSEQYKLNSFQKSGGAYRANCDFCESHIRGTRYHSLRWVDHILCFKCYSHREAVHSTGHGFRREGFVFEEPVDLRATSVEDGDNSGDSSSSESSSEEE